MTGEKLKEFIRRLEAEGYGYVQKHSYKGTIYGSCGEYADIKDNDDILFQPEYRKFAMCVCAIRDEVDEYMTAFLAAAPDTERKSGALDTRTLIIFNGHELAARQASKGAVDFVTWRLDRNGLRDVESATLNWT